MKPIPNYTHISVEGLLPAVFNIVSVPFAIDSGKYFTLMKFFFQKSIGVCVIVMEQSKVRQRIKSNDTFDLILTEMFGPDCLIGFSYRFKAPLITMNSRVILPWGNDCVANPDNPACRPYYFVPYTQHMSFTQRNINRVLKVILKLGYYMFAELPCEKLPKNYFVKCIPPLSELKKRTSLILVNCHISLNNPRHTVPGFF
jgi:glucuronosyltransferase